MDAIEDSMKKMTKKEAAESLARYLVDSDNKERNDYDDWCDANSLDPKNIHGDRQRTHVYTQALTVLGLNYPNS